MWDQVLCCGVTACPPSSRLSATSRGSEKEIPWEHFSSTSLACQHILANGYRLASLELCEDSQSVHETPLPGNWAVVIGNEALGVSREVLSLSERIIHLPIPGGRTGINVSCAFSAFAYSDYFFNRQQDSIT